MGSFTWSLLCTLICYLSISAAQSAYYESDWKTASISVNTSKTSPIPDTLLGVFFEEINHAGAGGLWAELVMNKGFEAGGPHSPFYISPWGMIGDEKSIYVTTEPSSPFENNKMTFRMDILCADDTFPKGGVGVFNPGFHGMNIKEGKQYNVSFYVRSSGPLELSTSFVGEDGQLLETANLLANAAKVEDWTKMEMTLEPKAKDRNASLQLTTTENGTIWFDQVSAMSLDTHKGHESGLPIGFVVSSLSCGD